ncbi:uncharacterized protein N7500_008328 [Penicillium coprophilum]|uniref:uncharacterized protein n=1 Tax=Penicillium coprophilum TaxID=36646 RepID=UPI00239A0CBA|nr:uncharacterized protein N7500_008328 [Penicillium coprophilum]KAJ5158677.1 hypothetical protein N7500_008328 [Penicillium coprophilum]
MSCLDIQLVAPAIHNVNTQCHEKHGISALAGLVVLSVTASSPLINVTKTHVRMIQVIRPTTDSKNNRRTLCPSFCMIEKSPQPGSTIERTIRDVALPTFSNGGFEIYPRRIVSEFPFHFDLPTNIPGTTKTPLGTISYEIEVKATTSQHGTFTQRRSVELNRQMILSEPTKTQHHLYFQKSNTIRGMTLSQNSTPRSGPRISFTATIRTHWETAPADRETELCHLVVRELRWQAEEVIKIMSKSTSPDEKYSVCERQLVRKLCDGHTKGYWGYGCNPYVKQSYGLEFEGKGEEKPAICIPFAFTIPKRALAVDDIDLAAYEIGVDGADQTPNCGHPEKYPFFSAGKVTKGITVHHQLKIELVTGEDVFHKGTRKLVERKRLRTIVCPAIPLSVCEVSL